MNLMMSANDARKTIASARNALAIATVLRIE